MRNTLFIRMWFQRKDLEQIETGIRRIRDEVREQGCPEPELETNGFFNAIFRPNPDVRAKVTGQVTHEIVLKDKNRTIRASEPSQGVGADERKKIAEG
jgi:predicted HTH transcriptional regulator